MPNTKKVIQLDTVAVRFVGDSGDGMQITGAQFTHETALMGNDLVTFTDYPAEIRAPAGSLGGVSGFQIHFGSQRVFTPGDMLDALIAMNPAALKTNFKDVKPNGIIVVNTDAFDEKNLQKAEYNKNPLEDGTLAGYQIIPIAITSNTVKALEGTPLSNAEITRCKNFYALGVVSWLYGRDIDSATQWIKKKFAKEPEIAQANGKALEAGYTFGDVSELFISQYKVSPAPLAKGVYRNLTGSNAMVYGLMAAAHNAGVRVAYGSYPITPASDILHILSGLKAYDVITFQAEDEICAICFALGASFTGALGVTATSGPGMSLKTEAMGLGIIAELPLVIINVQRGGPSTGLPTKTEQSDLLQAVYGRHGEAPMPVLAARSPSDCFTCAYEASRIALKYMTPVIVLSDAYITNGTEPWKVPDLSTLPAVTTCKTTHAWETPFSPYSRNEHLARPWVAPGTPGLEHRIGGLEKNPKGRISYDPINHQAMVELRAQKIAGIAKEIPPTPINGEKTGKVLVVGWGSSYGHIQAAVGKLQKQGAPVSAVQLRYLYPLPADLAQIAAGFQNVIVPEANLGQLSKILGAELGLKAQALTKVQGTTFKEKEVLEGIQAVLNSK